MQTEAPQTAAIGPALEPQRQAPLIKTHSVGAETGQKVRQASEAHVGVDHAKNPHLLPIPSVLWERATRLAACQYYISDF